MQPTHSTSADAAMPRVSPLLRKGFGRYVRRYVRRHFNATRLAQGTVPHIPADHAVMCYANHPGWWDPLSAILLHDRYFAPRTFYAPMDARALSSYPIFTKLGFFGIELSSVHGSKEFLRISRRLLSDNQSALWLTPAGRFSDVRERPAFQPGLAHLAATCRNVTVVPLAIEYCFWEERTPELLLEFGAAVSIGERTVRRPKAEWQAEFERAMAAAQDSLASKSIARAYDQFEVLCDGRAGVGGFYEMLRRTLSTWRGKTFRARHHALTHPEQPRP